MYYYTAYNLNICSDLPLPELQKTTEVKEDIIIRFGKTNWSLPKPLPVWNHFEVSKDSAYLYWEIIGKFLVKSGREIIIEPVPHVEESTLRLPLLGAVLGMLLHQRNHLILHGSAVSINGNAAIFIGSSGQGKSTMAASLYRRGHKLIADDVAALDMQTQIPILLPGFPQIKLWSNTVTNVLSEKPETLRRIHPEVEKHAFPTIDSFVDKPLPVKRIYVITNSQKLQITHLNLQEAVIKLIANSYIATLLGNKFIKTETSNLHISQCTNIVKNIPICQLERPRSFDLLSDVITLLEQDLSPNL